MVDLRLMAMIRGMITEELLKLSPEDEEAKRPIGLVAAAERSGLLIRPTAVAA